MARTKTISEKYNIKVNGHFVDEKKCSQEEFKALLNCVASRVSRKSANAPSTEEYDYLKGVRDERFGVRNSKGRGKPWHLHTKEDMKQLDNETLKKCLNGLASKVCYSTDDQLEERTERLRWGRELLAYRTAKEKAAKFEQVADYE